MKKGIFICFTGIDGSGKTTLANNTIDILNRYNINSKYVYCGWRQFDSFIFKPFVKVVKRNRQEKTNRKSDLKACRENKCYISKLKKRFPSIFEFIVLIDYYLIILSRLKIPLYRGKNIICDRYYYDMLINTGVDLNKSPQEIRQSILKLQGLFPKPSLLFLVDIPAEVAYNRKDDIPYKDYLLEHRETFLMLSNDFDMSVLDGNLPLENLDISIKHEIKQLLR